VFQLSAIDIPCAKVTTAADEAAAVPPAGDSSGGEAQAEIAITAPVAPVARNTVITY